MNTELTTNEHGQSSRVEENLRLAPDQGRISAGELPKWRSHYASVGYERATGDLLSRKVDSHASAAAPVTYSEALAEAYVERTVGPFRRQGYMRSVV